MKPMTTMPISEFKSKCIAVLKEAQRSGKAVIVTWRGRPIARVEPIRDPQEQRRLGVYRGRMKLHGEIIQADTFEDWEVLG